MMSMRILGLAFGIAAFGHCAGEVVVLFGSSVLRHGTLQSTAVGSIQQRAPREGTPAGGRAMLKDAAGKDFEVPCEVDTYALGGDQGETAAWRVEVPLGTTLRSLKVVRGNQVLARMETPLDLAPPVMEFVDSANGGGASVDWVLIRPGKFGASSVWFRWSWDEGGSWMNSPRILHDDSGTGHLNLEPVADGLPGGTLLEFWVPQGLNLTRIRHRIAGRYRPS